MNIAITGMSGFIGSHIFDTFTKQYPDVKVIGISRNPDKYSISYDTFDKQFESFDVVVHTAGKAHDLSQNISSNEYIEANTILTKHLFNTFRESKNIKKFIFLSSIKALADQSNEYLTESHKPKPSSFYGISKWKAEKYILENIPKNFTKQTYILRPALVYGANCKGNFELLFRFANSILPNPFKNFHNKRSFLYIDNLIFAINKLIFTEVKETGLFNVADNTPLSTYEIVSIIKKELNRKNFNIPYAKNILKLLTKLGDATNSSAFNSDTLEKLTSNYLIANRKITLALGQDFPYTSREGLVKTIRSIK